MSSAPEEPAAPETFRVVRRRQWGAWVVGAVTLALLLLLARAGVEARIVNPETFRHYLFDLEILIGVKNAFLIGTLSLFIATAVGIVVALFRLSRNPILVAVSAGYVCLFRGVPMLIQILFWFNALPMMFQTIRIAIPFTGITLVNALMVDVVTPFRAALLGISLAEAAYLSEIVRGAVASFDRGQILAAQALGMRGHQVVTRVVMPQVSRAILPSISNEYINLMKSTSLAMTIGYLEVLRVVTNIYYTTLEVVELLCVAAFWYLVLGAFATLLQTILERLYPNR
ncbi:amino acid ABC transporter permease [Synergistaceae bacterium OttesenSCG-928-I11]|nr:amino acid ABC transporter permease [Synergistaceae bacterium OttesenSCG-928-I11]